VEVLADVELTDRLGPVHEYRQSLADSLSAAIRGLDVFGPDRPRMNGEGQIEWTITASFVDPDGNPFRQRFLLRFDWAIATFEAVEMLVG
jgi:hypothetical protein